ncbi:hypothetical protein [Haloferax sp. ATB1]|uniref:hypothetical protein n=1 Tax=Haloferax sp. ATB1 TaxID=1508454 RepID=UPI0005B22266|nr:hypothetical protein [Haloferax sp. ATB1]
MTEQWVKQQREVDSYNLFFSSFDGLSGHEALSDLGYRLVGNFVTVADSRRQIETEPDFVLFDGETALLIEIKSGTNINTRDIQQMERCNELSYESVVDFLRDAEFEAQLDPNELSSVEPVIVYYSDFLDECRTSPGCLDALNELSQYCTVLSQGKGEVLKIEEGGFENSELDSLLREGIQLPKLVDKKIYLTENANREILAYSIAHDLVLNNLGKNDRISISPSDVMERYRHREIPLEKVRDALRFLEKIGGCRQNADGEFVFGTHHLGNLLQVQAKLEQTRVKDYLDGEEANQMSLGEFAQATETNGGSEN